ncbi:MAG TPA: PLP-dependent lyase/thiolase [Ilumatobacter sp.]|nr:PLP-dependent lyase/thiolase [Ilumatobacter sp.]
MIAGFRCAVCGTSVDIATPLAWKCPNATASDPHHVLHLLGSGGGSGRETAGQARQFPDQNEEVNPFIRYGPWLAWWAFARANGMTEDACEALTWDVAGDFRCTPFARSTHLSDELEPDVWVKDETGNVAGSHKARHLVSILLHLRAAEALGLLTERPPLAIASCGNAALAAATLAARAEWPLDVYVPTWMDDTTGARLVELGATVHRCERRDDDAPGDPAMLRFREAVRRGAIPFTVQGPENAYCLDGGRTIGWEIADQADEWGVTLDRILVQVGGGAFAACVGAGLGHATRLDTVQAEGCAPLADTWIRIASIDHPERYWAHVMRPWPEPRSLADGILDDETYDWIAAVEAMVESGGEPVVAPESDIVRAHELATSAGFLVSPTGSAGLAGLLAARARIHDHERVAVIMSGVAR